MRPLLEGNGRAEVLVSLDGAEKGRTTGRRTISVLLEENAVPETVRPYLESLLGQVCALEEGRGDALRICFLPARRNAAVLRGLACIFAVAVLVGIVESVMARLRMQKVPVLLGGAAVLSALALILTQVR